MRRRELLAAGGTVAAIGLAGCVGGSAEDDPGAGDPSASVDDVQQVSADGPARTVAVTSTGEASADPDMALLEVGVQSRADSASEARNEIAEKSEELLEALVDYGIDEDDITTQRYWVHDRIDRRAMEQDGVRPDDPEAREEYTFYEGNHTFQVEIHDVETVGEVIDVAVDAGADQVGHVTYTLSDDRRGELREEALREAISEAREEADLIAEELGAEIVEATVVDASEGHVSPVRREVAFDAGDGAAGTPTEAAPSTGIERGEVTVTARVRIEYEMA